MIMPRVREIGQAGEGVQAVVLVLKILELLSKERKAIGVTALAQAIGTTKSRVHRHLQTLLSQGYVVQAPETERYQAGPRLVTLGRGVSGNFNLVQAASPALLQLRDALGHFSVVSQLEPDGMRVLATVSGKSAIEIGVKQGSLMAFHTTAQGKVALAFGAPELLSRVTSGRLEMATPRTIVSADALRREINTVRKRGWAIAPNQSLLGLNALAAPIFDASGALIAAVAIVDSIQFIEDKPFDEQIRQTVAAGRRISEALGYDAGAAV
jgi:IclR family transcriptional regulator, KDG regulon repressor